MSLRERGAATRSFLAHPFEITLSLLFLIAAIGLGISEVQGDVTNPLQVLPSVLVWSWSLALGAGGILTIAGVVRDPATFVGGALERAGLWLAASAWLTLGVGIALVVPDRWTSYSQTFVVAGGCGLRLYASWRVKRVIEKVAETRRSES